MGEQFKLGAASEKVDEGSGWTPIPDNTFLEARLLSIQTVKKPYKNKETGEDVHRVEWSFEVTEEGPYKGRKVKGETSTNFVKHPDCRMFMWVQSLFGRELPDSFEFDTETLVGTECRVHMECKQGAEKRDKPGEFWINNRVKDVLTLAKASAGSAYASYDDEPF